MMEYQVDIIVYLSAVVQGVRQWRIHPLAESPMAPFGQTIFFDIVKKLENLVCPPLCEH